MGKTHHAHWNSVDRIFNQHVYLSQKIRYFDHMKRADFIEGMSRVAATVNVVTTDGEAGKGGITVSAMTSVSADPPTLLICIHEESPSCTLIKSNGKFCVNVLRADQADVSASFAGLLPFDEMATLNGPEWTTSAHGSPIYRQALVSFDCSIKQFIQVGTHVIFFGEVLAVSHEDGMPLIYVNRGYQEEK